MDDDVSSSLRREGFPALGEHLTFLDWGSTGLLAEPARLRVREYLDEAAVCPSGEAGWMHVRHAETLDRARSEAAALIGARKEEVAVVESTTVGLLAACEAIPLLPGENVILSGLDYGAVAMPWKMRARRDEIELRFVPSRTGRIEAEDVLAAVDEKTRVMALSSLAWTTGALTDLGTLGEEARRLGILFIVDGVQSVGVVPMDVKALGIDFLAVGGHKWLCSPLGAGFLYVDRLKAARYQPRRIGMLSGRPAGRSFIEWFQDPGASPEDEIFFLASARTFEAGGTPNYPGIIGLQASLELFGRAGPAAIHTHVLRLGDDLMSGLEGLGFRIVTPREEAWRAGVVVFNHGEGPAAEKDLVRKLRERRIVASVRYCAGFGGVRVCLHGMNDRSDVGRLLEALAE